MNRELFIESINALERQYEYDVCVSENLEKAFPNCFPGNLLPDNHFLTNAIIKILQFEMNDTDLCTFGQSWIEYFCFELNFGKKNDTLKATDKNGKNIPLSNAGELYDFLNHVNQ